MRLVFWNCGIAPTKGSGKRSVAEASAVVKALFATGVDLVALCEVDEETVGNVGTTLPSSIRSLSLAQPTERSRWDLGVFYRRESWRGTVRPPARGLDRGTEIRAARRVKLTSKVSVAEIWLYLAHWRSRGRSDGWECRTQAAQSLWRKIEEDLAKGRPVVVMGDFNDEPFDRSVSGDLRASRDPGLVMRRPESSLFNPCWHLSAPNASNPWEPFGSYRYPAGRTSRSYLFDQAMTSAHFLDPERPAPLAQVRTYSSLGLEEPATLDHLPLELTL